VLGLAGSLKVFPLLLVAGYVAERRWLSAVVSVGVAAVLWLHVLVFDAPVFTRIGGPSFYVGGISLYAASPILWTLVSVGGGALLITLAIRRSRWTWLAASAAIPLAVPRVWLPDAAYILVGAAALPASASTSSPQAEPEPRGA